MIRFLPLIFFLVFLSCQSERSSSEAVILSGQIVNPTNEYVVLYKNDQVVDSARLDENNRFNFTLLDIDEGLHHFDHNPEQQYVFLEKGDSMLIRLNTMAFDESLVFSGSNEQVNNFMIEMFLNYEDEEQLVQSFYKLSPKEFDFKIDSLREQKIEELHNLIIGEDLSSNAYAMARATIDYNSYIYKEKYPFYHKKSSNEPILHALDSSFYDYRSKLDFNNAELAFFRPYYEFMINHFGNLSYMSCQNNCKSMIKGGENKHLHLNKHKIQLIDSLVENKDLRDNLFRNVAVDYLLNIHKIDGDTYTFIDKFHKLSNNSGHKNEIVQLFTAIEELQENKSLPNIIVQNAEGQSVTLKSIAKQHTTVFYFWTASRKRHFRNVTRRLSKLKQDYPDHQFVGISLKTGKKQWASLIKEQGLNEHEQFWGGDFDKIQQTLLIDNLNKCVIAKDSIIVDGFANIFKSFQPKTQKALAVN